MTDEKWIVRKQDEQEVAAIRSENRLSETVARLLCNRGLTGAEEIGRFLKNDLRSNLHDPFLLKDMEVAVHRIEKAIKANEKITIYGDYDVDGITSTVILFQYLSTRSDQISYYIPSRTEEGYGLNNAALDSIREGGSSLLITVDTGTTAVDEIAHATQIGLDVLVTDHHECMETLPDCPVVNPKRKDSGYPFSELAGVGVVFKLLCALIGDAEEAFCRYGGITAVGTIADIMPLLDENRSIVRYGLKNLEENLPIGMKALLREGGVPEDKIDTNVIAYQIAPRMNAAGRISDCKLSVQLLLEQNPDRAEELAKELCRCNLERKEKEQQVIRDIDLLLAGQHPKDKIMIYASDQWHNGVIGIAASRLTERYSRPCILICFDGDSAKGSARSVRGVNLFDLVSRNSACLENFGGHEMAVGLTLKRENYDRFVRAVTEDADRTIPDEALIPTCEAEFEVDESAFSVNFVRDFSVLEPFGNGNPYPSFVVRDLRITAVTAVSGGKHTRLQLEKNGRDITAMWFGHGPEELDCNEGDTIDIFCTIFEKTYRQRPVLNVTLHGIRISDADEEPRFRKMYLAFQAGQSLPEEGRISRTVMVAFYRYLFRTVPHEGESTLFCRPETIVRAVRSHYGIDFNYCKFMLCLDTLNELGLTSVSGEETLAITLHRSHEKVDLTKTSRWSEISSAEKG